MSYCRFSSERWTCSLYCYETEEGFVTFIAAQKYHPPVPKEFIDPLGPEGIRLHAKSPKEWKRAQVDWDREFAKCVLTPINSVHAGKYYVDGDIHQFLKRLLELKKDPELVVPDWVIETVKEEIESEKKSDKILY